MKKNKNDLLIFRKAPALSDQSQTTALCSLSLSKATDQNKMLFPYGTRSSDKNTYIYTYYISIYTQYNKIKLFHDIIPPYAL